MEFSPEGYQQRLQETQQKLVENLIDVIQGAKVKTGTAKEYYVFDDAEPGARFIQEILEEVLHNVVLGKPKLEFKAKLGASLSMSGPVSLPLVPTSSIWSLGGM